MYRIDFSIPWWLINYYHVIGTISLIFDAFSIYLVVSQSTKIDNFRFFLLNFQIACLLTDIQLTFLMQPVPLYPLVSGYSMGFLPTYFNISTHFCLTVIIFFLIYQIESMVFCFVRKHQTIADTLKRYKMPNWLVFLLFSFFAFDIFTVCATFYYTPVEEEQKLEYVRLNFLEYFDGFKSLPNFSIYEPNQFFIGTVTFAVSCGITSFFILILILFNIFRMLGQLKLKISKSNYRKHRAAIYSLIAQFGTSSVCFVPPIFFVFVVLIGIDGAQIIVEVLLMTACLHSPFNVIVLVVTFPPYRKFVFQNMLKSRIKSQISARPSVLISHLTHPNRSAF